MESNLPALINSVLCFFITVNLMFYRRVQDRTYRPWISYTAYLLVITYASIPFRYLFGLYESTHWLVVIVNFFVFIAVFLVKGNIAHLIDK
ncbi:phage holin family protein [Klebsiella oxytoca]|uniref:Phage holin family protein n=1 Tax=Klebsiella oxytoca TaxID=571 RepID=A0A6B8MU27_KLEOX|nr:phage holin family protein [Klebsiella oxytoca]QGN37873.1 phage holin family protein [Klebsiella oxytoca]